MQRDDQKNEYTPAIDIWGIGCIFAEILLGKPLFPGKSVVHQLDLITDLLGTPSTDTISGVRNEKARKYLMSMRKKRPVSFAEKFPKAYPAALKLLQKLLACDRKDRPSAEEVLLARTNIHILQYLPYVLQCLLAFASSPP